MFHAVQIYSNDSPRELNTLGLKLKFKHSERFITQPCVAYRDSQCAIYPQRPRRCQLFECRQIKGVTSGKISESMALDKIREVVERVAQVNQLLHEAGKTDPKRPLTKRYEKITAEPVDPSDQKAIELRARLGLAMQELTAMIETDFRPSTS